MPLQQIKLKNINNLTVIYIINTRIGYEGVSNCELRAIGYYFNNEKHKTVKN
jgi:hypothetical protein